MAERMRFRDIVSFAIGGGWGSDQPSGGDVEVAVIRGADFPAVSVGDVSGLPIRYEAATKAASRALQPGDVVLEISGGTNDRPTGRSVFIGERIVEQARATLIPASFCRLIRFNRAVVDPRYVSYWLRDFHVSGRAWEYQYRPTGIANFQFEYFLESEEISLPPLPEQRSIAQLLGALDDKIELNRRMNETLEATARAIFKSWFVDFDPVRAKMNDRGSAVRSEVADLFPCRLRDSPIGSVPEGWDVAPLGDHIEVVRGISYRGADLGDEGLPLHNLNSVLEGGGYKYDGIKYYAGEYRERDLVEPGEVIVANTEQGLGYLLIGYPAVVPSSFGEVGIFSHHLYRIRAVPKSPLTPRFLYLLLLGPRTHAEVVGYTNGTTVNMLAIDGLRRPRFAVPPAEIATAFNRIVAPLFECAEHLVDEASTLARVRDWLLPRLVSGV